MSSTIWPMLSSTDTKHFTWSAAWLMAFLGKGQRVMGRMRPALMPSGAGGHHGVLGHAGGDAEGYHAQLRVVHHVALVEGLVLLYGLILLVALEVLLLQHVGLEVEGVDDVVLTLALGAGEGPGLVVVLHLYVLKGDGLHHLANGAVSQDHGNHAVLVRQVEALDGEAGHLLDGGGSQDDHVVVAVSAAPGGLEVVALAGLDAAETGAAALDVHYESGYVTAGDVAQALAHQGDSGAGGGGHHPHARGCGAVDHVDGSYLALRLEEDTADLGHLLGHVGGHLRLGSNGVAEIVTAAGLDRRLGDGLVALHQYSFCHTFASLLLHSDDAVGAHGGAEGAADALGLVGHLRGGIAFLVDLVLCNGQNVLGASLHTQSAALTEVRFERYFRHGGSSFIAAR